MSQAVNCSFYIDELAGLEVPMHKRRQLVTNSDVLIILHKL